MSLELVLFLILGLIAIAAAVMLISARNPIGSAIGLIAHFMALAGLYLTLNAQFMAVIQVLVYAGAIMVLVVFVIMLLNLGDERGLRERVASREGLGIALALLIGGTIILVLSRTVFAGRPSDENMVANGGIHNIGRALFTTYVFPFEMVSLVLLAAVVGAVVLTKRKLES